MKFKKTIPVKSFGEFYDAVAMLKTFTSSNGRRYEIRRINGTIVHFIRLDANRDLNWQLDLMAVYQAYIELQDFDTINFKKYVPIRHSPARGLLLATGCIN